MKSFTLSFFLRKTKKEGDTKQKVFARVIVAGDRRDFSIGKKIESSKWSAIKGRPIGKFGYELELSRFLLAIEEKLFKIERELLQEDLPITADNLINRYQGLTEQSKKSEVSTLMQAFELHNTQMQELKDSGQVARETNGRYRTTAKFVKKMLQQYYKKEDVALSELNLEICHQFERWLRKNTKCANNTLMKYIKNLKKITRMSVLHGWMDKDPFVFFKCKQDLVARDYLTNDEIERLKAVPDLRERMYVVRQLFLLGCYTGLSYSDLCSLKKEDLVLSGGELWIIKARKKTRVVSRIPVLKIAKKILDELGQHPRAQMKGLLVPVYPNQHINSYLKELASLAKISKNLTFHVARHTFATTVTLANGVSLEVVSAQLGHTNIRQTQHYARMVNSRISSEMEKVNKLLGS